MSRKRSARCLEDDDHDQSDSDDDLSHDLQRNAAVREPKRPRTTDEWHHLREDDGYTSPGPSDIEGQLPADTAMDTVPPTDSH